MIPAPAIPGLLIYCLPTLGEQYVIGADPAQGNPASDDSSLIVFHVNSGEEVASLTGKIEPSVFANYITLIGNWYNAAPVMVERNLHGHSVIMWLQEHSRLPLLCGPDNRVGWHTSEKSKAILFNVAADAFRDEEVLIHTFETYIQLTSIEGSTLKAPEGEHDDRALACALGIAGIITCSGHGDPREAMGLGQRVLPEFLGPRPQSPLRLTHQSCEAFTLGSGRR